MKVKPRINCSDKLLLHSSRHFFTSDETNGHKSAILAPIKFFLTPFYSSRASDSDGIYNDHVRKNGCQLHPLRDGCTSKAQGPMFIASCQVNSYVHKNIFYTKRKVILQAFLSCIIQTYRIRHASSHHAFFITCSIKYYFKTSWYSNIQKPGTANIIP